MNNPLNDIAPYPTKSSEVTADALARNLTVVAQLNWRRMLDSADVTMSREATNLLVTLFGIVKVLKALQAAAPDMADEVASDLWSDWEDGGSIGDWLWSWLEGYGIDPERVNRVADDLMREAAA